MAEEERILKNLRDASYIYAKTMPRFPHDYTLKQNWGDPKAFEEAVLFIRANGKREFFFTKEMTYLYRGGYKYWSMGAPVSETILINRARVPESKVPYHSALSGVHDVIAQSVVQRVERDGCVAFVHDLEGTTSLPSDYSDCDLFYAELPWPAGYDTFIERAGQSAGDGHEYKNFQASLCAVVASIQKPMILIGEAHLLKNLPGVGAVQRIRLHNRPAYVTCYNVELPAGGENVENLWPLLAKMEFKRVGDFCCGYGNIGMAFFRAGKTFVMSDINASCIGVIEQRMKGLLP